MKKLDFKPYKSKDDFRNNYKLHDMAEEFGKNLLTQWGVSFKPFGEDRRYQPVWEKGEDKPDILISYKGKEALLDWKGKRSPNWILNKRAAESYLRWSNQLQIPVILSFFIFSEEMTLITSRCLCISNESFSTETSKAWDKNEVVELLKEPIPFTKPNLLKLLDL
jgi:hypothetical protein